MNTSQEQTAQQGEQEKLDELLTTDCEYSQIADFDGTRINVFRLLAEGDLGLGLITYPAFLLVNPATGERVRMHKAREQGPQRYCTGEVWHRFEIYEPSEEQKLIEPRIANLKVIIDKASLWDIYGPLHTTRKDGCWDMSTKILREPMSESERHVVEHIQRCQAQWTQELEHEQQQLWERQQRYEIQRQQDIQVQQYRAIEDGAAMISNSIRTSGQNLNRTIMATGLGTVLLNHWINKPR